MLYETQHYFKTAALYIKFYDLLSLVYSLQTLTNLHTRSRSYNIITFSPELASIITLHTNCEDQAGNPTSKLSSLKASLQITNCANMSGTATLVFNELRKCCVSKWVLSRVGVVSHFPA